MLPEIFNGLGHVQQLKALYQSVRQVHPFLVKWIEKDFISEKIDNEFVMDMVLHALQFLEEAFVLSRDESLLLSSEHSIGSSISDMEMISVWVTECQTQRHLSRAEASIRAIGCLYRTIDAYYFENQTQSAGEIAGTALLAAFAGSGLVDEKTAANINKLFVDRGVVTKQDWKEWDEISREVGIDRTFKTFVQEHIRKAGA